MVYSVARFRGNCRLTFALERVTQPNIFRYTYPQSYLCLRGFYVWSKFNEPDWSIFDAYQ